MNDPRIQSPAAQRNRQPILEVLQATLPERATVLEIASGGGEHAVHFAAAMPGWTWQPSDASDAALASIQARRSDTSLTNLCPPVRLDTTNTWPEGPFDAVVAVNLIHIAPWAVAEALAAGAASVLRTGGHLVLYGPFKHAGQHTAASNEAFDADLRRRDPSWGIRDAGDVVALAESCGLLLERTIAMPANNETLVFRRQG
ncbi:MAG: DUF938 domain-containing protein [Candidatus Brocadiia bacterium]